MSWTYNRSMPAKMNHPVRSRTTWKRSFKRFVCLRLPPNQSSRSQLTKRPRSWGKSNWSLFQLKSAMKSFLRSYDWKRWMIWWTRRRSWAIAASTLFVPCVRKAVLNNLPPVLLLARIRRRVISRLIRRKWSATWRSCLYDCRKHWLVIPVARCHVFSRNRTFCLAVKMLICWWVWRAVPDQAFC